MTSEFEVRDEAHLTPEAEWFADALVTLEVGGTPQTSPTADPELTSMIRTVAFLRAGAHSATETAAYRSYHARSRAYVLHTLEQQRQPVAVQPVAVEPASIESVRSDAGGGIVIHIDRFLQRHRRVTFATPIAAAAAAAALFLFSVPASAPTGSDPRPAIAQNQTAATADVELARIQFTLATIANRSASGQTVDAILLRTVTETASAVANRIETAPQTITREHVANYQRTIATGNFLLSLAQPTAGSEDALAAAQRAAQDGHVTAARFLGADEATTGTPATSATTTAHAPTPAADATATATATAAAATPAPNSAVTPEATLRP